MMVPCKVILVTCRSDCRHGQVPGIDSHSRRRIVASSACGYPPPGQSVHPSPRVYLFSITYVIFSVITKQTKYTSAYLIEPIRLTYRFRPPGGTFPAPP